MRGSDGTMQVISGKAEEGLGRANALGYPTANIAVDFDSIGIGEGVYIGMAMCDGQVYGSAVLLDEERGLCEVHMLDYSGESCYDKLMTVEIKSFMSDMDRSLSGDALEEKIRADVARVREYLGG
jgi:FAD synthase